MSPMPRMAALTATLLCSLPAYAQPPAALTGTIADRPYLFGDWDGARTRLADRGITFKFSLTDELMHNFSGGNDHLTRASTELSAGVTADLDRLWGIHHTTFTMVLTNRFGRSVDADAGIGTSQQSQEIYGRGQTTWLTQLTLGRTFFDGRLELLAGRGSEGDYYDASACTFVNLSLCGTQGANLYGSYWMSHPGSVWMANATLHTSASTQIGFGVFQQNPTYYDATWERSNAWKPMNPHGTDGIVLPLEFRWTPKLGGMEGSYRVGAMINTGGMPEITTDIDGGQRAVSGLAARQSGNSYNAWVAASQRLTGSNGGEGLTVGFRGVMGDRATSVLDRQMTVSAEYQNPWHQIGDRVGLGFAATHTSSREAEYQAAYNALHPDDATSVGHGYEYTTELYYAWQALRFVSLQPTLQYVVHPGGTSQNHNAFFAGMKSTIQF
ncbi:carbohydrate porin [Robbsia sp. KACC 23696]|uniref:carbohydrate porin n=1 Tax=Robbsia sp. KACC 23696 TaxID=3149231 RepID=UPI00325B8357